MATRNALNANTAKGLMIYDTTTNSLWIHHGNGNAAGRAQQQSVRSTIIPCAPGNVVSLNANNDGSTSNAAALGFKNSNSNIFYTGGNINLSSSINFAFSMPGDGNISSVSAQFNNTNFVSVAGSPLYINAQLFNAPVGSNVFTATASQVTLFPFYTGVVLVGSVSSGIATGLNIAVTAQDRLLLVFYAFAPGSFTSYNVQGYASAGVSLE